MIKISTVHGLDLIESKANRLSEIIKEAKTLAEELASCEVTVSYDVAE